MYYLTTFIILLMTHLGMRLLTDNIKAQWYIIHVFGNLYLTYKVIPPIIELLCNPFFEISLDYNPNIIDITIVIHLYHLLFFKCSKDDIWHHFSFGIPGIFLKCYGQDCLGKNLALNLFFVCGLPGAIDYFYLALLELNYIDRVTRIKQCCYNNNWFRSPGLIVSATFHYLRLVVNGFCWINIFYFILSLIPSYFNGQYYLQQILIIAGKKYQINIF